MNSTKRELQNIAFAVMVGTHPEEILELHPSHCPADNDTIVATKQLPEGIARALYDN